MNVFERSRRWTRSYATFTRRAVELCPTLPLKIGCVVLSFVYWVRLSVAALSVRIFGKRFVGSFGPLDPMRAFPVNMTLTTPHGTFSCRRGTDDVLIASGAWETELLDFFAMDAGVFVDVGAHIGKYAVMVGRQLTDGGSVIAIEPDAGNFAALTRNISLNGLDNVRAFPVALSNQNGVARLYVNPQLQSLHSLIPRPSRSRDVPTRTLDSLLEEIGVVAVDKIKIDVEGAEFEVLQGATRTLRRNPNVVVLAEIVNPAAGALLEQLGFKMTKSFADCYLAERVDSAGAAAFSDAGRSARPDPCDE